MKRKDDFHFDFNEDAEPVEELHRMRVAMAKHFKTTKALADYLWSTPSQQELIARLQAEDDRKKTKTKAAKKELKSAKPKKIASRKKAPARRKSAKSPTHA
ncbi:MAG: hypothetical protein LBS30_06610 [Planctomycetota bacterium]|jgi:hypothetical protein|nr:hypothetical protein [Planctomycetota bacterium]